MGLSALTVWEVRTVGDGGDDENGGGYRSDAGNTDYSQQAAPQVAVTDAVTDGTTTISSTNATFESVMIGNLIYIAGGTGSITGAWYEVITRVSPTIITVDRSTGLTTGTGATLNLGGALLTIGQAITNMVASNIIYVRGGIYSQSAQLTIVAGANSRTPSQLIGYSTTRGDEGKPEITHDGVSGAFILVKGAGTAVRLVNFELDGVDIATRGWEFGSNYSACSNLLIHRIATEGIRCSGTNNIIDRVEVTDMKAGASVAIHAVNGSTTIVNSLIHDNPCLGIDIFSNNSFILWSLVYNNTGGSSDGVKVRGLHAATIVNNVFYGNGRDGIRLEGDSNRQTLVQNNILAENGGYGINGVNGAGGPWQGRNNAYHNNTSGARNNVSLPDDTDLSGDPFTAAGSDDFSLNNTAGAGAACRAAGFPGVYPAGLTTGFIDIGAAQHEDAGVGAASILGGGQLTGGFS